MRCLRSLGCNQRMPWYTCRIVHGNGRLHLPGLPARTKRQLRRQLVSQSSGQRIRMRQLPLRRRTAGATKADAICDKGDIEAVADFINDALLLVLREIAGYQAAMRRE